MDRLFNLLLIVHVVAGFSSLILFFIPAIARKGGKVHNQVGRYYVRGMWTVVITAAILSAINYGNGELVGSTFLGFLALLTARPLFFGVAVINNKRGLSAGALRTDMALRGLLAVAGPYMIGCGLGWWGPGSNPLQIVFGFLGILASWPDTIRQLRGTFNNYNWLHQHLGQMVVTAIAAFTAFFAFGAVSMFGDFYEGNMMVVTWTAPTVLGLVFTETYKRRLRKGKVRIVVSRES